MTETEICKNLRKKQEFVKQAIYKLAETTPSIQKKLFNHKILYNTDFSLEETLLIYKELNANFLQIELLKENWIEKGPSDLITINGTQAFLQKYKNNPKIKCCNTCKYLKGLVNKTIMPQPYCSVYECLLTKINAKVYEDWCTSYVYAELPKPRQWFKESAPSNLNMFGDIS